MQSLFRCWKRYLEEGGEATATDAGIFLIKNAEHLNAMRSEITSKPRVPQYTDDQLSFASGAFSFENLAGILLGRIQRFIHLENKPKLKEAGLDNADDFNLLATLYFKKDITKGQLMRQSLIEPATGTEILKRMKRAGWVDEKPNPLDGRSLLVTLTQEGRMLTENCFLHLKKINSMLTALDFQDLMSLITILEKLDNFHSERHELKTIGEWMRSSDPEMMLLDY